MRRALPILAALALAGVLLALVLGRGVTVRTDMAEFLPEGRTPEARLVLAEARAGSATGLILVGIEGAAVPELARISREVAAALNASGRLALVAAGQASVPEAAAQALFARRYLLADADFSEPALRAGLERLLAQLQGSMAPLALRYGLADPPGASAALLRAMVGNSPMRAIAGAWFAPDRDRALLLARTKAAGMDIAAQEAATAAVAQAFADARPGAARLMVAGPAVFARDSARAIKGDVERISVISSALVLALLWWRFRRPLVLAAIAGPMLASIAVAALAVQWGHGAVHGVTLGFGITMLGVSLDYPVLMIGHRKQGEPAYATRARIGRAFVLAVVTAALGLAAMVFSGFPGLSQLGVFSAVGLAAAAAFTWWLLPRLVVLADLAPVAAGDLGWVARLERLRRFRLLGLVPVVLAAGYLAARGGPEWEDDLQSLSPVPAASRALDAELRASLGAADAGQLVILRGPDAETVLRREEALLPALERLRAAGALGGYEAAARILPSVARQEARRAALPDAATLAARLDAARAGLPFREAAFAPFLAAVEAARTLPALTPATLEGPLAQRLAPLLAAREGEWRGTVPLQGVTDRAAIRAAVAGLEGAVFVDLRQELGTILAGYMGQAWAWLGISGLAVLLVLGFGLRQPLMVARVLGSVAAAGLVAVAVLTLGGARLSLLHLVALQLVAGVGLDYALFFARRLLDQEERARTLRTLVTCNAMTLLTFGLLAACETPVLRDIGATVALGAALALGFAFLFAGERRAA